MERIGRKFAGHARAAEAERAEARALAPAERLRIAREILRAVHGDLERLPDVRAAAA